MKKLLNILIGVLAEIGKDRYMHYTLSSLISSAVIVILSLLGVAPTWCLASSVAAVIVATIAKEYFIDERADALDALANIVGAWVVWFTYIVGVWR